MTAENKTKANALRRELAAELSKKKPDKANLSRIKAEIYKIGGRCYSDATHKL